MKTRILAATLATVSLLAAVPSHAAAGKDVYDKTCFACHGSGAAGAPKLADKAAWAPRIATGAAALHSSAIKGKGLMPPKGANTALSDADVIAAVEYMIAQSK